jgi:hypothetical protein
VALKFRTAGMYMLLTDFSLLKVPFEDDDACGGVVFVSSLCWLVRIVMGCFWSDNIVVLREVVPSSFFEGVEDTDGSLELNFCAAVEFIECGVDFLGFFLGSPVQDVLVSDGVGGFDMDDIFVSSRILRLLLVVSLTSFVGDVNDTDRSLDFLF